MTADPLVYTATFTAADGFAGTGSVSVAAGSYTDAAGNAGGAGSDVVAIDRTADEADDLALSIVDTAINAAERSEVAFTTSGIDADVAIATVTFSDPLGNTVTVAASAGVAGFVVPRHRHDRHPSDGRRHLRQYKLSLWGCDRP